MDWYEGRISATERAAEGLYSIHVDVSGSPLVGSHSLPGQYLQVGLEGMESGIFAIASGPDVDGRTFELLVKRGSDVADALIAARVGTKVRLKAPAGHGFPLDEAYGKRVLLFATGSGISAIRSLILAIIRERAKFRDVTLYFGARTPNAFAYQAEMTDWERSGITVIRTVSQPGHPGWEGLEGYVQAHLPQERFGDAVAFVCGQGEMVAEVTKSLTARGLPAKMIFQNV